MYTHKWISFKHLDHYILNQNKHYKSTRIMRAKAQSLQLGKVQRRGQGSREASRSKFGGPISDSAKDTL